MSPARFLIALSLFAIATPALAEVRIEPQRSGTDVRLRGISAVDASTGWASGRKGTVLRTTDGGATWQDVSVPSAEQLDFRDVEGFDAQRAVVLSIGNGAASRVYRTENGGRNWILVLRNADQRAFFDCMVFDGPRGWLLGDPVDGRYQVYATDDGGRRWTLQADGPQAAEGQAAFAASGTCIARSGDVLLIGGSGSAPLYVWRDGRTQWQSHDSGMGRAKPEAGVFSIAPAAQGAIAVGGDYKAERAPGNAALWRGDALQVLPAPRGFRSGVACMGTPEVCVAVGPAGADAWSGQAWAPISETGYDAIDMAGDAGWASGDAGRIGRVLRGDEAAHAE